MIPTLYIVIEILFSNSEALHGDGGEMMLKTKIASSGVAVIRCPT